MLYRLYSDGSTRSNGSENAVGAWAYVMVNDKDELVWSQCGSEVGTTNQRMELTAAIKALDSALAKMQPGDQFVLFTDSAYLHNCYEKKWYDNWYKNGWINAKKEPVANKDLWLDLVPYFTAWGFDFRKVKGHTEGHTEHEKWNNYVDNLAQTESLRRKAQEEKQC